MGRLNNPRWVTVEVERRERLGSVANRDQRSLAFEVFTKHVPKPVYDISQDAPVVKHF